VTLTLRRARLDDIPTLDRWDREPHVISATTDKPGATIAFEGHDWHAAIANQSDIDHYLIAEVDGRRIGAMQVIDPHLEPTHYWGDIEPNLRALDIWIGEADARGRGHGEQMMRESFRRCFADPAVTAIVIDPLASNTRALAFYERLGFVRVERRLFNDEDDCWVMRLTREAWRARFPGD
jgi:aminoglycoside 6'-N-acetyltransferase